jgi:hypothetical protein
MSLNSNRERSVMGRYKSGNTGFLFADPSFLQGVASVLDIGGTLLVYNESESGTEADARAIATDWAIVGKDIEKAIEEFEQPGNTR